MPEEYLTDDEQLEHVKHLAAEYGPWMISAVVIVLGSVYGFRYYEGHKNDQAMQAAVQFGDMTAALQHNDSTQTRRIADGLIKDYPSSPYADQAKLILARLYVDDGQDANAIPLLTQVMDTSKDSELKHIARLRLARVQIDQGKPDDAIKTLSDAAGTFAARYHEVRGDAFYAKKDLRQAVNEYQAALGDAALNGADSDSALLALKISDLGLPAAPIVAAPIVAAPIVAAPTVAAPTPAAPGASAANSAHADTSNKAKP
jgi:predicted negative regulator of RcsB-dependent stress response